MQALISPNEKVIDCNGEEGQRIAQVEHMPFEVAEPLFWTDCPNDCVADLWYFIGGLCQPLPVIA